MKGMVFFILKGIFSDFDNNKIAFIGSNNETLSAVKANFETTVIFKDTENSMMVDSIDSLLIKYGIMNILIYTKSI